MTRTATTPTFLEAFRADAATQDLDTLMKVYPLLKAACQAAESRAVHAFAPGDIVTFALKGGTNAVAIITKVNARSLTCEKLPERLRSWNVPPYDLTRITAADAERLLGGN